MGNSFKTCSGTWLIKTQVFPEKHKGASETLTIVDYQCEVDKGMLAAIVNFGMSSAVWNLLR